MPADKLDLLSDATNVKKEFLNWVEKKGEPRGGYRRYLDLSKESDYLPFRLYCGGRRDGVNKLQFNDVAHLGLSGVRQLVEEVFRSLDAVRIYRSDWCVDLPNVSVSDFAYCRAARAHNCQVNKSPSGTTFYVRFTKTHKVIFYDKLAQLRARKNPEADCYPFDQLTRVEVQLAGRDVPYRMLKDIERYKDLNLIQGLTFWSFKSPNEHLTVTQGLAREALRRRFDRYGLQAASKMFSGPEWAYLWKTFLVPASPAPFSDLNDLMKKSARDWLEDRIRFPRLGKIEP
jgi:hypothetical protein